MGSSLINGVQINWHDEVFLFLHVGLCNDLPACSCDKTLSPELDTVATVRLLQTDAIDGCDVTTVGNGV